jgi:hypothetical protein
MPCLRQLVDDQELGTKYCAVDLCFFKRHTSGKNPVRHLESSKSLCKEENATMPAQLEINDKGVIVLTITDRPLARALLRDVCSEQLDEVRLDWATRPMRKETDV